MTPPPTPELTDAADVLRQYPGLDGARLVPLTVGLINLTYRVEPAGEERFVLQRLHPIFGAEVNLDIEAVTAHLAARGIATPRLLRTTDDALWVAHDGVWRVMTHLPGRTVQRVTGPPMAREAAALLGRFHRALADLDHRFHFVRRAHGLAMHADRLRGALAAHRAHRLYDAVAPVAEALLERAAALPALDALPQRITHGDPKISNLLFLPPDDRAHALVDLDTLGQLDLPTELGDAFRSWCNPAGEDGGPPELDLELFEAAVRGYADEARALVSADEGSLLVAGLQIICVELACRFAADALDERYFGWDPERYPSRGDHNLHRARVQLALARSVGSRRSAAEAIAAAAFES